MIDIKIFRYTTFLSHNHQTLLLIRLNDLDHLEDTNVRTPPASYNCSTALFLILKEVRRIREEHPDDSECIVNKKVKGRLRVTRAFGAGYLKQVSTLCQNMLRLDSPKIMNF